MKYCSGSSSHTQSKSAFCSDTSSLSRPGHTPAVADPTRPDPTLAAMDYTSIIILVLLLLHDYYTLRTFFFVHQNAAMDEVPSKCEGQGT
jgi:hypothetical protein